MITRRISLGSCLLALVALFLSGCVIAPHEGYYDRDHHRYWHDHHWHRCLERDVHCR